MRESRTAVSSSTFTPKTQGNGSGQTKVESTHVSVQQCVLLTFKANCRPSRTAFLKGSVCVPVSNTSTHVTHSKQVSSSPDTFSRKNQQISKKTQYSRTHTRTHTLLNTLSHISKPLLLCVPHLSGQLSLCFLPRCQQVLQDQRQQTRPQLPPREEVTTRCLCDVLRIHLNNKTVFAWALAFTAAW